MNIPISDYKDYLEHLRVHNFKKYQIKAKKYRDWYENQLAQGTCPECNGVNLKTIREDRGEHHFEFTTYCKDCGSCYVV